VNAERRLADIAEAVAEARRALADGAMVDVAGLDAAVSEVCAAAEALPPHERRALADGLASLAEALDQLAADIVRQGEAARRRQANDAYGS
jgi:hypothetical protein